MKKIFILLFIIITLTGCNATYELNINGDKFKEKITTYIYDGDRENAKYDDEATASRINAFVERDVYPFFEGYEKIYHKKVDRIDNYERVILEYDYVDEEYMNSNAIKLCFENKAFDISEDLYSIKLNGYFYCLYDNNELNIEISTRNKVVEHNADEKVGNKYIWHINKSNFKNVNINIELGKKNVLDKIFIGGIVVLAIAIIVMLIVVVKKKHDKINSI